MLVAKYRMCGYLLSVFSKPTTIKDRGTYEYYYGKLDYANSDDPLEKQKRFTGTSVDIVVDKAWNWLRSNLANPSQRDMPFTFHAWLDHYIELYNGSVEPSSFEKIRHALNEFKQLIPDVPLTVIRTERLQKAVNYLRTEKDVNTSTGVVKGLSPSTVRDYTSILRRALQMAVNERLIPANPAVNLIVPRVVTDHHDILSWQDTKKLFAACNDPQYGLCIIVCLLCATRKGEIIGLTEDEIDMNNGTINIKHQYRSSTKSMEKTKTKKAHTIAPPALAFELIQRQITIRDHWAKENAATWHNPDKLIFTNPHGGPLCASSLGRYYGKIVAEIGRPELTIHDLRRTAASNALSITNNPKAVQNLLGHATLGMTLYYCDMLADQMRSLASAIDEYYRHMLP